MPNFDRKKEFTGKCPECKGPTSLVHITKDGKAKCYKCKQGHSGEKGRTYPVYIIK
jgi:uncharacterized paraquat-inducible protein A